jgi:hypothetical protein
MIAANGVVAHLLDRWRGDHQKSVASSFPARGSGFAGSGGECEAGE